MSIRVISFLLLSILLSACDGDKLVEGGLYSNRNESGTYSVLKILKLDDNGVHVRLYSNQFDKHPESLDETALHLSGINRKPNESLGMGHLPLSRGSFATWEIRFIKTVPVTKEELAGYNEWKEAQGGYF